MDNAVSINQEGQKSYRFSWPLSKTTMAQVIITGQQVNSDDIDMLTQYLGLAKTALQKKARVEDQP